MSKIDLFTAWRDECISIAGDLSLPLAIIGIDAATGNNYTPQAGTPYLSMSVVWGEETRPYLNGSDGQNCNSIVQIDCVYPREKEYNALLTAENVKAKIFLDSNIGGVVYNVTISPVMRDANTVMHSVSVTIKQVDI